MEVDAAEPCCFVEMAEPVADERLCNLLRILLLPGKIEAGHDAGVLIEARSLRQSTQSDFDLPNTSLKLQVGKGFFIQPGQRKEASVSAALQCEDVWPDEAGDWHDAASRSRLRKPRGMFDLFSVCAGHSSSSG
jgi:hypothetical protein